MKRKRHRWAKVKLHVYICRDCGTGEVHVQRGPYDWYTVFHLPSGVSITSNRVPPCERGPRTDRYLAAHQSALTCAARG